MTGFIGGGKMAEALIKGILRNTESGVQSKAGSIMASEPDELRRKYLEQVYGIKTTPSNKEAAAACSIIILAVKPQNMETVLDEIADTVTSEKSIVSIAAGITLDYLGSRLKTKKLIRVMPNTPAVIHEGMSVISPGEGLDDKDLTPVKEIFTAVGKALVLPEKYMDAVTALSGSGPAFIALFTEAMIEASVRLGLDREHARGLAIQTLLGTARLLDSGMSPQKLREMVTSPAGTTAAGLAVLEKKGLSNIIAETLEAAKNRAEELGRRA